METGSDMPKSDDPEGYYSILGLAPNASHAQIQHAYREWAKRYHPDARGTGDTSDFIRIKEAYDVLSDPTLRRTYDDSRPPVGGEQSARNSTATGENRPASRVEPIKCSQCGAITAQPRFCVFYRVWSVILYTRMEKPHGVYCGYCARRNSIYHSALTWLLGWWSVQGVFWTPLALWKNFNIGEKPKLANANLLINQGIYFAQESQFDIAHACFEQAMQFAEGETLNNLRAVQMAVPPMPAKTFRNQWVWERKTVCIHTVPLIAVIAATIVLSFGSPFKLRAAISPPGDMRYVAAAGTSAWMSAGNGYTNAGLLPKFTTIMVIGPSTDPKFIVGRIHDGQIVTVATSALAQGDGQQAKSIWCSQNIQNSPMNNEVFKRTSSGPNQVTIRNLGTSDAVAQFRNVDGMIALSLFVAANSAASVNDFPDGNFRLEFATGHEWSRPCNLFTQNMAVQRFPDFDAFISSRSEYQVANYTITPVVNGNIRPLPMDVDAFETGNN
jgi:hypothetical protein